MDERPTIKQLRDASRVCEYIADHISLREGYDDTRFFYHSTLLEDIANRLEEEAKPEKPALAASLGRASSAIYLEIPGKDKVVAVYVGGTSNEDGYMTQVLDGHPSEWAEVISP